jgi:hypothetical protein
VGFNISLDEIIEMPLETRYFIRGFLAGAEPGPPADPPDEDDTTSPDDLAAWRSATARFRRTGSWYGRWGTCSTCGCVLLPDSTSQAGHEHATENPQSED